MKFKLKDYVRHKVGTTLEETGALVPSWVL
jgi:hypothetical protein